MREKFPRKMLKYTLFLVCVCVLQMMCCLWNGYVVLMEENGIVASGVAMNSGTCDDAAVS